MLTLKALAIVLAGGAALGATILAFPSARRAAFCNGIVNPYDLEGMYIVTIPQVRHAGYDREFVRFARASGLRPQSGTQMIRELGGSRRFLNFQTTACDGVALAWSENAMSADEFVVTFHSNRLFGNSRARKLRDAFVAGFRSRYRIETEDSDFKRHPVR